MMTESTLLTSLFQYKTWANNELFSRLETWDSTAHSAERHKAIEILDHIHVVDRIFRANLQRMPHAHKETHTEKTPALKELLESVKEVDNWYVGYVTSLGAQDLAESIEFTFVDGTLGRMSREEMLAHVVTHGSYHRGEVGRILSQLSITRPREIFTGYLHKSEPARRERT